LGGTGGATPPMEDPTLPAISCQYPIPNLSGPCSCDFYEAGQVLSGIWLRIVDEFRDGYGTSDGMERARKLHVLWTLATSGGPSNPSDCNSAHPGTLTEVLLVDDDDGNLNNGTPNEVLIRWAFEQHGVR
jgi:hypothetical protein